jgi:hypothetical protein
LPGDIPGDVVKGEAALHGTPTPTPVKDDLLTRGVTDSGPPTPAPVEQPVQSLVAPTPSPSSDESPIEPVEPDFLQANITSLSGRIPVWRESIDVIAGAPIIGSGFHADRLILGTHLHNAYLHALLQTGVIGAIFFLGILVLGWILAARAVRLRNRLPTFQRYLVIQSTGVLAFFTVRTITESTGAFYSIDWIILAPVLLYLQVVDSTQWPQVQRTETSRT